MASISASHVHAPLTGTPGKRLVEMSKREKGVRRRS
jgi:hypothetical protein